MKLFLINTILGLLLFSIILENVAAFSPILRNARPVIRSSCLVPPCLFAVGRDSSGMDDMRRLLESSWNAESMGSVPTNVESAAEAAVTSAMNALSQQAATGGGGAGAIIMNVNILLAQFDISLGKNLYDEVLSVDFCIALANRFKGKSCIVVRDDETVRIVRRVLDAREKEKRQQPTPTTAVAASLDEDDDDDEEDKDDDDDDEFSIGGESNSTDSKSDVDSFRKQLMAGWESEAAEATKPSSKDYNRSKKMSRTTKPLQETSAISVSSSGRKRYRLCSMFGNAVIPKGTDMMQAVVEAVAANALPEPDEETIIILSAVSREEMIGVRSLVANYQGAKKKFILVNCKLGPPVPVELKRAQTVYSILPLIAKPAQRPENLFVAPGKDNSRSKVSASTEPTPMKIVVLRRFPRDWEVFVDCNKGKGFELAATAPASQVPQQGPSMEWVSTSVKRFLQTKA